MEGVFFLRFPQQKKFPEKCTRWVRACSRQNFTEKNITKDTYICSKHFVGENGPTEDHPDPIPATATKYEVAKLTKKPRRLVRRKLVLTENSMSAQNLDGSEQISIQNEPNTREVAEILLSLQGADTLAHHDKENNYAFSDLEEERGQSAKRPCYTDIRSNIDLGMEKTDQQTQTSSVTLTLKESLSLKVENYNLKRQVQDLEDLNKKHQDTFSYEQVENDDSKMHFYTGLSCAQFLCLWKFLGPAVNCLSRVSTSRKFEETPSKSRGPKRKLSPKNELFLTLMRLRLGLLHQDLAYRFGISVSTVNEIVSTWIQFMYLQFDRLRPHMFPSRKKIQKHLPKRFRKYRKVRVILDATEFFTQAPRNYEQQGNMYSSYKNHCTCKVLIGITPSGAISFVSDVYEGSISDKEILSKSKLLDKINPGDLVMVDRGFNVRDLLLDKGADIVIPPFLGDRQNLTPQEESQTRLIAKLRIHVERVIERMKKFKILKKIVTLNSMSTFSQTVFVVACLVNFQKPMVK